MRKYLGASAWSHCDRAMWLKFRHAFTETHTPEQLRTFGIGHACEDVIIADLEARGFRVGHREKELTGEFGQPIGHIDGVVKHPDGRVMLLEMKTANDRRFKEMMKNALPDYYAAQVQIYMHNSHQLSKSGNKLTQCYYCILNKNTSEMHEFEVGYDPGLAELQSWRIHSVIEQEDMPPKDESWKCEMCGFNTFCEFGLIPNINCRTCANVSVEQGDFKCEFGSEVCDNHIFHPAFITALGYQIKSVDRKNMAIEYDNFTLAPKGHKIAGKDVYCSEEYKELFDEC